MSDLRLSALFVLGLMAFGILAGASMLVKPANASAVATCDPSDPTSRKCTYVPPDPLCVTNGFIAATAFSPGSDALSLGKFQFLVGDCTTNKPITYPIDSFFSVKVVDTSRIYVEGSNGADLNPTVTSEGGYAVSYLDGFAPTLLSSSATDVTIQWVTAEHLQITQHIFIVGTTAANSAFWQTVSIKNLDVVDHSVALRIMWDLFVDSYDGTWIQQYSGATPGTILGIETNFPAPGSTMSAYAMGGCLGAPPCTTANFGTGSFTLFGSISSPPGVTTPDRFVYGWWGSIAETAFFYTANSNLCSPSVNPNQIGSGVRNVGGCHDSAVLYYFGDPLLHPGDSATFGVSGSNSQAPIITPTGVPEFPLGMTLLLVAAIPTILLLRTKRSRSRP